MKYRPKGWVEKRREYLNLNTMLALSVENNATYEAGADAILEALEAIGNYRWRVKTPLEVIDGKYCMEAGTWVFIPKE